MASNSINFCWGSIEIMSQREGILLYSLRVFSLRSKYYFALNYPNPSQFWSFYPNLGIFNLADTGTVTQHSPDATHCLIPGTWANFAATLKLSTLVLIPARVKNAQNIEEERCCCLHRNKLAEPSFKSFVCFEWFRVASLPHRERSIKSFLNLFWRRGSIHFWLRYKVEEFDRTTTLLFRTKVLLS